MSPRKERRQRRDWRNGWSRRFALFIGWMALLAAVAGLVVFGMTSRVEAGAVAAGAAVLAAVSSGLMPEPKQLRRKAVFAPLENLRAARRRPSLARQLLTLP
jgi:TRAP-type mannitol/chloroaromatic compound transport system permease large subunit